MALGVDPILSPLAQRELALSDKSQVPDANVYAKLGDDWWALAEKEKEPVRSVIRDHAAEYYLLAQGGATGLDKAALQQKVERSFGAAKFLDAPGNENGVVIAPSELNPGTAFTLEFWMSTQAVTGTIVSKRHQEEGESSIVVRMNEGVPELGTNADYHWDAAGGKSKINDGAWHHLAVVRLGRQVYLYIDGKKECQVESLNTYSSKSPWKAGVARGQDSMALRLCRLRVSGTPRYLLPFVPDKQYGKDAATIYPK